MQPSRLQGWAKGILICCGLALIAVLFFPMWRIDLVAPQYPEGLVLLIYPAKLGGNVDIINGLNHYIGMKTLHSRDFIEFTLLPYLVGFFAAACFITAMLSRKKIFNLLFILFVAFGVVAMYDFWRWEYNYGHNLNPEAAIIVPGMAYQPPLIGFKQLLNFGAYSTPDIGGWIFLAVGAALLAILLVNWRMAKRKPRLSPVAVLPILFCLGITSCTTKPEPIKTGTDNCSYCKMLVSEEKFGAELITKKGKVYKFDDVHCIVSFLKEKEVASDQVKEIFFTDFCGNHELITQDKTWLLKSDSLDGPMGGHVAAFKIKDSLLALQQHFPGVIVSWKEIITQ